MASAGTGTGSEPDMRLIEPAHPFQSEEEYPVKLFHRSAGRFAPSQLGLAVSAVLLGQTFTASADILRHGIAPVAGVGGMANVVETHGVPVINIVKPNRSGLSHNQYQEYNVGSPGLIINNSLVDGTTTQSLQVQANPQFVDNRSASTILNEVIGSNRSIINGRQEIFGDKADYVLSNPNGLWVNGGWIATKSDTTATLLVGTPVIQDGQLTGFDSRTAGQGQDAGEIAGPGSLTVNGGGLRLIAPRIDMKGELWASGALDVLIGRHHVDASTGDISDVDNRFPAVDARLVGAMQAQRIRIVTSQQGVGIHMPTRKVSGRQGIDISSAGKLVIAARQYSPDQLQPGVLESTSGDILLESAERMQLSGLKLQAQTVTAHAGTDLKLDTLTKVTQSSRLSQVANPWQVLPGGVTKTHEQRTEEQLFGTQIDAQQITLSAQGNLDLQAARLSAEQDISLTADHRLTLDAGIETTTQTLSVNDKRPLTTALDTIEKISRSAVASNVAAGGKVSVKAKAVEVRGSEVRGREVDVEATQGDLQVTGIGLESSLKNAQADSLLFATTKDLTRDTSVSHYFGSHIGADDALDLKAAQKLTVRGSNIDGKEGTTRLKATAGIELLTGQANSITTLTGKDWVLSAFADETRPAEDNRPGSMQWAAGAGVKREKVIDTKTNYWERETKVKGGYVQLDGGESILSEGASVKSQGTLDLNANDIRLLASVDKQVFSNSITGDTVGMQWTGGLNKAGSALFVEHQVHTDGNEQRIHTGTRLTAGHDLNINAKNLTNVGTQMFAEKLLSITADRVDNRAAIDVVSTQIDHDRVRGSVGATLDYGDIANAIYKAATQAEQPRFHQQNIDDNLVPWSVGLDVAVDYQDRATQALANYAKVTRIEGGEVTLKVTGAIQDQGTQYSSHAGITTLKAMEHTLEAAANTLTTSLNRLDIETLARLEAFTPVDFGVKLAAAGYQNDRTDVVSTAVVGHVHGKRGVQIQLGTNGLYEGTVFSSEGSGPFGSEDGDISLRTEGNLSITQAQDTHELVDYTGQGKGTLKLAFGETVGVAGSASGNGRYSMLQSRDSDGRGARFTTPGKVTIQADRDLLMQGTDIGNAERSVAAIDVSAGGRLSVAATSSSRRQYGDVYAGGGNFKLGRDLGKSATLEVGGSFQIGQTDETEHQRVGAQWLAVSDVSLSSLSGASQAIDLEGLAIEAGRIDLKADAGGIRVAAARSTIDRDNREAAAGFGIGRVSATKPADDTASVHARVKVTYDQLDSTTYANAQLKAREVNINTGADLQLQGTVLQADTVNGSVEGDLRIASVQDDVQGMKVDLDLRAEASHNPLAMLKAVKAVGGPFAKKTAPAGPFSNSVPDKWSETIRGMDDKTGLRIDLEFTQDERNTVAQTSAISAITQWGLQVAGNTELVGATLGIPAGAALPPQDSLSTQSLSGNDYHQGASVHLATGKVDQLSQLWGALNKVRNDDTVFEAGMIAFTHRDEDQIIEGQVQAIEI
jgi:hemolysin